MPRFVVQDADGIRKLGLAFRCGLSDDPRVREFRDDDTGYRAWLAAHPDGYVISIVRGYFAATAHMHHADCRPIDGQSPSGGAWTGPYVKICAEDLPELERWAKDKVGELIRRCGA